MVTFPEDIHPKHGLRLRFEYAPRAFQYLDFFKIITFHPEYKFTPLDLTFTSSKELYQFLYSRGIVFDEMFVEGTFSRLSEKVSVVDTIKIYDVEDSINKYLLNYKFYSINEVAEMLSFSRPTIYKIINEGKLKTIRINGQMRIKHIDLTDYINNENQTSLNRE
ncbi:MAG TPA: helix-turn-helix domain-containing protein [Bacteroidales bacterium]|nr:helix-turn-helix domain-containing protein [Bacteroidales bacterium]